MPPHIVVHSRSRQKPILRDLPTRPAQSRVLADRLLVLFAQRSRYAPCSMLDRIEVIFAGRAHGQVGGIHALAIAAEMPDHCFGSWVLDAIEHHEHPVGAITATAKPDRPIALARELAAA